MCGFFYECFLDVYGAAEADTVLEWKSGGGAMPHEEYERLRL